ncbi:MAG: hypothetical protein JWO50_425 [Candidatus Kaiserbacteria bacterium]|nr:hypothetical protein [Candidatus Kaiserbacteria bacterium]
MSKREVTHLFKLPEGIKLKDETVIDLEAIVQDDTGIDFQFILTTEKKSWGLLKRKQVILQLNDYQSMGWKNLTLLTVDQYQMFLEHMKEADSKFHDMYLEAGFDDLLSNWKMYIQEYNEDPCYVVFLLTGEHFPDGGEIRGHLEITDVVDFFDFDSKIWKIGEDE